MKQVFICHKDKLTETFCGSWPGLETPKCVICGKKMRKEVEKKLTNKEKG